MSAKPAKKPIEPDDALQDSSGSLAVKYLHELARSSVDDAAAWIKTNWSRLSTDQRAAVKKANDTGEFGYQFSDPGTMDGGSTTFDPTSGGGNLSQVIVALGGGDLDTSHVKDRNWEKEAATRIADSQVTGQFSADLDGDGKVEAFETKTVEKAKTAAAKATAKQTGASEGAVKASLDNEIDGLASGYQKPIAGWLQQYTGGAPNFTDQQKTEILRVYNQFNPDSPVSNTDELMARLAVPSPDNQQVVEGAMFGTDPQLSYTVSLANGGKVTVDDSQFQAYKKDFSNDVFNRTQLTNLVRTADRLGVTDAIGNNGWQIVAALASASGGLQQASNFDISKIPPQFRKEVTEQDPAYRAEHQTFAKNAISLNKLSLKFKEGQATYGGNDTLAFVHALNPQLAARIANTKPDRWAQNDIRQFQQYLLTGGFDQQQLAAMGYYALGLDEWDGAGGGRAPQEKAPRMKPDPDAIRQAAKDLFRSLYAADPTEAQLASMVSSVSGAVSGAADDQSVDANAQVRKAAEAMPEYKALYGNKPAGMTEEEYQQQFRQGAATLLGNEAVDPSAIQSGMRSGQYQTTLGAVAASKQAWGNSTFLGRLAQAAQIVGENT